MEIDSVIRVGSGLRSMRSGVITVGVAMTNDELLRGLTAIFLNPIVIMQLLFLLLGFVLWLVAFGRLGRHPAAIFFALASLVASGATLVNYSLGVFAALLMNHFGWTVRQYGFYHAVITLPLTALYQILTITGIIVLIVRGLRPAVPAQVSKNATGTRPIIGQNDRS